MIIYSNKYNWQKIVHIRSTYDNDVNARIAIKCVPYLIKTFVTVKIRTKHVYTHSVDIIAFTR